MAAPISLRNLRDAHIAENRPVKNYVNTARLKVQAGTGVRKRAFVFFGKSMPAGVNMTEGFFRVWNADAQTGSVTLTIELLNESWAGSRVTWDKQPGVRSTPNAIALTKSNAAKNTLWEFNILPFLQYVAGGGSWYGIRITTNSNNALSYYSTQAESSEYRPQVVMQWNDAPEPPDGLEPNNGNSVSVPKPVLSYEFSDVAGDTDLAFHQVQIDNNSDFSSVMYDSTMVPTTDPSFDLNAPPAGAPVFTALAADALVYWRVKVQDGSGATSEWSTYDNTPPASFKYLAKPTLNVSSILSRVLPGPITQYYVEDSSPTVAWSVTGSTQVAYQVFIRKMDTADKPPIWDTGKITGTVTTVQAPKNTLKSKTAPYELTVRVWDNVKRQKEGDRPIYTEYVSPIFYYAPGTSVTRPTSPSVALVAPWPWVDFTFYRGSAPDSFSIYRDDELVENDIAPGDIFVSGTKYVYRDRTAAPREPHTWLAVANVNGTDSQPSDPVTTQTNPNFSWLMEPDSSNPIAIVKSASTPTPAVDAQTTSMQEVHQPLAGLPVLITQQISGFEGHVDGVLSDEVVPGLSGREMRRRFKKWKRNPGTVLLLYMVDEVLRIVPYNMTYRPRAKGGGKVIYDISFDFFEVD